MKSQIVFADDNLKDSFLKLKISTTEDKRLYDFLLRAFEDLENDAFCGIQIPKKLIPRDYERKYWRLIYTIKQADIVVLSIVLEWLDHKNYERRFGY